MNARNHSFDRHDNHHGRRCVAVIGGGLAGLAAARELTAAGWVVRWFDRNGWWGVGTAYRTPRTEHRMNVPAARIGLPTNDPGHFVEWAQRNGHAVQPTDFVPRSIFGDYLSAMAAELPTVRVERIAVEIVRITAESGCNGAVCDEASAAEAESAWRVWTADGRDWVVCEVVMALGPHDGHRPPRIPGAEFMLEPWQQPNWIEALQPNATVVFLGTGLTMVDWVLTLDSIGHRGQISAISRHGWLPSAHVAEHLGSPSDAEPRMATAELAAALDDINAVQGDLRRLVRTVGAVIRDAIAHQRDWQPTFDALRPYWRTWWQSLDVRAKRQFVRHVAPLWNVARHRMPPGVADEIARMRATGRLAIHAGTLMRITPRDGGSDGVELHWRPRRAVGVETTRAAVIVDATGFSWPSRDGDDVRDTDDRLSPLMRQLIASGAASIDPLGFGLRTDAHGRLIGRFGLAHRSPIALGALRRAHEWECTAIHEIRTHAAALPVTLATLTATDE